jgi:Zn-finger nucleic acid-binding protein
LKMNWRARSMEQPRISPVVSWQLKEALLGGHSIQFACPHCNSGLNSPLKDAGTADTCPNCQGVFLLPIDAAKRAQSIQAQKSAEKAERQRRQDEERRQRESRESADQQALAARQQAALEEHNRRASAQNAANAAARRRYLDAVSDLRRTYKVLLADSAQEAEVVCNRMGFEGWELEQSFSDTFVYKGCCGPESKRQFVLIFSQPCNVLDK